jgi:Arc/MetJ-type ribon-helix-helix transcriptional regulator
MTIHLKPELEALIQQDVKRGPYQSVDEFVQQAVQMLNRSSGWPKIAPKSHARSRPDTRPRNAETCWTQNRFVPA